MSNSPEMITKFPIPNIEGLKTEQEYIDLFIQQCIKLSGGQLRDFSESSPLRVIAEAQAALYTDFVNLFFANTFPQVVAQSWELLGIRRDRSAFAQTTARFQLDGIYQTQVIIPSGYQFSVKDIVFETTATLVIPAYLDTVNADNWPQCSVNAISLHPGIKANVKAQPANIASPVIGLQAIYISDARGGSDEETPVEFRNRLARLIAAGIDQQNRPVVNIREYEHEARAILGPGSVAIAVPERDYQGHQKDAAVTLYILGAGGLTPTPSELARVKASIEPRAPLSLGRFWVEPMPYETVTVMLSVTPANNVTQDELGKDLNTRIRETFNLETTQFMNELDLFKLTQVVYNTPGVSSAEAYWSFDPDQPKAARLTPSQISPDPDNQGLIRTKPAIVGKVDVHFSTGYKLEFTE